MRKGSLKQVLVVVLLLELDPGILVPLFEEVQRIVMSQGWGTAGTPAEMVTLPTHVGSTQQVDNGRIIQAADIKNVSRVATSGSSHQRQAVRDGGSKFRAKIVATERERVG